jgi:hypothetical protein
VNPFGMYLAEPVIGKETIVYADLDLDDRIVAKNIFDSMGHYSRWDVVSLNLREKGWSPISAALDVRRIDPERVQAVAKRHGMDERAFEAALADLSRPAEG